ncbi:hypothetical protein B0W48_16955 [Pseudoalteromonas aliena]|uniref:Uncharacterized protein n=1 Tax=Pseudoalteromonas aliena TaxID=247523 RepID=A0A1Q2H207_9GAMM|nr:hypothetical protein B0W48_16955 [Pseudoalteromonas aliena]
MAHYSLLRCGANSKNHSIAAFFAINPKKRKIRAPYAPDLRFGKRQYWLTRQNRKYNDCCS